MISDYCSSLRNRADSSFPNRNERVLFSFNRRSHFETKVERMTSLLEPALILVMGGIVGGVVVVMLLSIVSVNDVGL